MIVHLHGVLSCRIFSAHVCYCSSPESWVSTVQSCDLATEYAGVVSRSTTLPCDARSHSLARSGHPVSLEHYMLVYPVVGRYSTSVPCQRGAPPNFLFTLTTLLGTNSLLADVAAAGAVFSLVLTC